MTDHSSNSTQPVRWHQFSLHDLLLALTMYVALLPLMKTGYENFPRMKTAVENWINPPLAAQY